MKDIPKLKQSTIEKHEVKVEPVITFPIVTRAQVSELESEAVAFATWIAKTGACSGIGDKWYDRYMNFLAATTSELYELYKKSK